MKITKYWTGILTVVLALFVLLPAAANGHIAVPASHSLVVAFNGLEKVAVANPDVADVVIISSQELIVVGKTPGVTTLQVWSSVGRNTYDIEVAAADPATANDIKELLGNYGIKVSKVNKTIVLEGNVADQYEKSRAEKIAGAFGEKVVNLLEVTSPRQVKIEAKIVEISKDKTDSIGIKWGNDNPGTSPGIFSVGQSQTNDYRGNAIFGGFGTYAEINAQINALIENGNAKILSQPNIVTLSGEKANILIGGEIPVPTDSVSNNNSQVTIEWKEYGIKLDIEPEVSSQGLISSRVKAEVSSLDYTSVTAVKISNNLVIPALKSRKAETKIALQSGQTMAIGGLISKEDSRSVSKLPLLGDIPVLGKLFTSTSFTSGKTEIIIFMTPTLINTDEYSPAMTASMKELAAEDLINDKKATGKEAGK